MSHLKFHLKVKHRTSDGGSPKQSPRGYTGGPGETLRGYLKKQGDNGPVHSWKTRYFLQKPGSTSRLYYYPTHNSTTPKGFIDLNEVSSVESGKTGFYFKIFTPNRTYHLKASNEEELNYWVEGITTELGNLKKESSQEMLKRCKPTAPSRYKTTNKFVKQFLMAEACTSGDIKAAQELLKDKDIDINFWVEGKSAPIVLACSQKIEFAKMFIEDPRADLNCCDDTNGTPLLHAISSENIDVIRALLKDERLGSWDDEDTLTILCAVESGNAEILSCILEHPPLQKLSNPAALEENFGTTSLHYACMSNNLDKVMSLLEDEDLDPNEPDSMQMTPLHVASCLGFLEIVQALLDDPRVDTEIFSDHGYTALHFACKKGHVDVVNFLLVDPRVNPNASAGDETPFGVIDKNTPNAAEIITALLEHPDIDLDMPCTILEDLPFHHFCVNGNAEILKILLEDPRIDPTIPNAVDDPPLLLAVGQGNTETVRTLLSDDRIQPDILNQENENLFYIAARSGHAGVIQALLDDNRLDPTALKEDINSLMEALPIQIAYARGQTDCVKILCSVPKVQENFASTIQRNELFLACAKGDSETVKKVLADSNTDVNFTDAKGRSSLHLAAVTEDTEILELLLNHPEIKVNLQDRTDKETPLHAACSRGRIKSVDILLSHPKIDPTAQDSVNETPFTNACRMDNYFFIKMLLKHPKLGDSFLGDIPSLALFTLSEIGVEDSILNMILSDSRVKSAVPSTLCYACKYGNANFVQQILAAKLIAKDEKLFKQCFEACGKPSSKVAEEWDQEEEDITTIKQLLQEYFEK